MKIITDKNEALSAVRQDGRALKFASDELRNDREVVLRAVVKNKYKWALQYASEELRNDREFFLDAVKRSPYALEYASEELRNDREFFLEAVRQTGDALEYADEVTLSRSFQQRVPFETTLQR